MSAATRPVAIVPRDVALRVASTRARRVVSAPLRGRTERRRASHPARARTRASSPREGRSDDGPTLVETSSGGQQQRRWGRTPTGGFDRLPPKRPEEELSAGEQAASGGRSGFARWDPRLSPRLRAVFLPAGYPDTVSPDYAPFIRWHLGSLMFRNILEVITAQSLLVALGMGSTPGALPLTAATKWVLKDGIGSLATLAAGSLGGQKCDEDPKRWWMVSNAFEDVARVIELVTPAAPGLFLPLAATATFVRTAALTGRGSLVNGSLMQHFARNENTADVRARLEVQGRWLALVALPVGIGIFRTVSQSFANDPEEPFRDVAVAVAFYGSVVIGHLVCIWNAAKVLRFETLNRARLVGQARAFRDGGADAIADFNAAGESEGVFRPRFSSNDPVLGASLPDAARDWAHLERLMGHARDSHSGGDSRSDSGRFIGRRFALGWNPSDGGRPAVLLDAGATPRDVLAAALAGVHASTGVRGGDDAEGFERAYAWGDARVDEFAAAMAAKGWRVDFVQLGTAPRYRLGSLPGGGEGGGGTRGGKGGSVGVDASVDDVLAT